MRYRQRIAIQAPVGGRDSTGAKVTGDFETIDELASVPATVRARIDERRYPQMTPVEDRYDIVLAGEHRAIAPEMVVLDGAEVYDIERVSWTPAGWPRPATLIEARRVSV